ncbi:ABC transporter ATP-binding protein [Roseomonas terrae]|jgi:ABC-type multidrug transport system fused ATPase/permease subunit|uniref:ABC transporter ATP-binding protein n=1 Tax=Neoroseomonas terrae TaxID=424799 RepID=A0ABS5EFN4_9PROT|nr:ABC transporter ATP-binding protein [Neoroseomonas terrae]MBR0649830.1 ABC transporter ATP-binding protein [Neoroseomonas terrae]
MKAIRQLLRVAGEEGPAIRRAILWRLAENLCLVLPMAMIFAALLPVLDPARQRLPEWLSGPLAPLWIGLLLLVAYLGQGFCANRAADLGYGAGYRLTARLRARLVDHLARLPVGYLRGRDTGDVTAVLMQDVTAIEIMPGLLLPRFVAAATLPLLGIAAAFAVEPMAGLVLSGALALALLILAACQRMLRGASERRSAAMAKLNGRLLEFVRGIQVVRAFNLATGRLREMDAALAAARDSGRDITMRFVVPASAAPVALALGTGLLLALVSERLVAGSLSAAGALLLLLVAVRLFAPLAEAVDFSAMVRQMEVAIDRVDAILAVPLMAAPNDASLPPDATIRFEDVVFGYGATPVLRGVSFTAEAGAVTAIVGATGAGKTTIARLLAREWDPEAGRITIGGVDLRDLPAARIAELIGVVSQSIVHFSLSLRDNLRIGRPDATEAEMRDALRAARCEDLLARLPEGLDTVLQNAGAALSGGERQRLALARLFLKDSPIVVLDEATSSLDVENERLVQEALAELTRGRTVLVIAHRLWTVRGAAKIVVLEHGTLREQGSHEALRAGGGAYAQLWAALRQAPGWRRIDSDAPPLLLPGAAG